jgi:AcrR family transcriptional regulator
MSAPPTPRKRGRYHHGNLPPALVEAALEVIAESGAEALTLREVASRVGVTHAAPYRHFKDKAALLAAVADEGFARLCGAIDDARAHTQTPLVAAGAAYLRFARDHAAQYQLMFGSCTEARRPGLRGACDGLLEAVRAVARSASDAASDDIATLAQLLLATWHGLAVLQSDAIFGLGDEAAASLAAEAARRLPASAPPASRPSEAPRTHRRPSSPAMRASAPAADIVAVASGLRHEDEPSI